VIDSRITDYDQLITDLEESNVNYEILELDETTNGIEEITQRLNSGQSYSALHIIGHGEEANLQLGSVELGASNIDEYQAQISSWSQGLTGDADILLYGCDVAGSQEGIDFVDRFNELTGADVAASSDLTGDAAQGGNWEFEYVVGTIETDVIFSVDARENWTGTLATIVVDTNLDEVVDDDVTSLREAVALASSMQGADVIQFAEGLEDIQLVGNAGIAIGSEVTIIGADDGTVIDASVLRDRVFRVTSTATLENFTIQNAITQVEGGALLVAGGTAIIDGVDFIGNTGTEGGAIRSSGHLELRNSSLIGNTATLGGGGLSFTGTAVLENVTVSGNTATGRGGGVFAASGTLDANNLTLSGNHSDQSGGGIHIGSADLDTVENLTVTNNSSVRGSGVRDGDGTGEIFNSIIVGNTGGGLDFDTTGAVVIETSIVGDNNSSNSNVPDLPASNITGLSADAVLEAELTDINGGPVQTHALVNGSAAIDAADPTIAPVTDARGVVRDASPDIGAFEFDGTGSLAPIDNVPTLDLNGAAPGEGLELTFTENDSPLQIAPAAVVDDSGEGDIVSLTLDASGFGTAGVDTLIFVDGHSITAGTAVSDSTFIDGVTIDFDYNGVDTITFTNNAGTNQPIQASSLEELIHSIEFQNTSGNPTPGDINFDFTVEDSSGQQSTVATSTVSIAPPRLRSSLRPTLRPRNWYSCRLTTRRETNTRSKST